jgi:hypothetical protein
MGQFIYFDAITNDSTGNVQDADLLPAPPTWSVFEQENDTPVLTGTFTKRVGQIGNYRAKFELTDTAGFVIGNFYSVIGMAWVNGTFGKCVCLIFRVGPAEEVLAVPNTNVYNIETYPAQQIADELLDRDMAIGIDSGTGNVRTVRQALRFLRNRWYIDSGVLYVCKETDDPDDPSWTAIPATDANAEPITGVNPQGGTE